MKQYLFVTLLFVFYYFLYELLMGRIFKLSRKVLTDFIEYERNCQEHRVLIESVENAQCFNLAALFGGFIPNFDSLLLEYASVNQKVYLK
jgi:hypothetical protein